MDIPRKDTARGIVFDLAMVGSSSPLVGATPTIMISKDGKPPTLATGYVSELQTLGKYVYIPSEEDVNDEGSLTIYPSALGAANVQPIVANVVTPYGQR
jgi:hypothetical protein